MSVLHVHHILGPVELVPEQDPSHQIGSASVGHILRRPGPHISPRAAPTLSEIKFISLLLSCIAGLNMKKKLTFIMPYYCSSEGGGVALL